MQARPTGHVLLALGFPGANAPRPIEAETFSLRPAGPDSWLIVGDRPLSAAERETALGADIALVDLSHGRERLEISGPGAARKLAAGVAIDLSPSAFPEGASCETLFGPIAIHLTRTGPDRFEIFVSRSYAMSLWRGLT